MRRRRGGGTLVSFIRRRDDVVVLLPPVLDGQARRPRAGPAGRWLRELGGLLGDGVQRRRRRRRGGFGVDGVWWFLGSRVVTPEYGGRRSQRVGTAAKGAAEPLHHDGAARRRQTRHGRAVFVLTTRASFGSRGLSGPLICGTRRSTHVKVYTTVQ
jgi:hypothetical protein